MPTTQVVILAKHGVLVLILLKHERQTVQDCRLWEIMRARLIRINSDKYVYSKLINMVVTFSHIRLGC